MSGFAEHQRAIAQNHLPPARFPSQYPLADLMKNLVTEYVISGRKISPHLLDGESWGVWDADRMFGEEIEQTLLQTMQTERDPVPEQKDDLNNWMLRNFPMLFRELNTIFSAYAESQREVARGHLRASLHRPSDHAHPVAKVFQILVSDLEDDPQAQQHLPEEVWEDWIRAMGEPDSRLEVELITLSRWEDDPIPSDKDHLKSWAESHLQGLIERLRV